MAAGGGERPRLSLEECAFTTCLGLESLTRRCLGFVSVSRGILDILHK